MATILGFDIGLSRTGVASGQRTTQSASPVTSLKVKNGQHDWAEVDKLIAQWKPIEIVVGYPGGSDAALNKAVNRFKSHIQQRHKLNIIDIDETLSTHAANQEMVDSGVTQRRKTERRDQFAACLILESYLRS